jgi:hypothetical protein
MYEIRPESVKTFLSDKSIKLPRYQRKQTWDDKKNFELAISLFRGYPLGVVVLNKELNKKVSKWLIDGRQRRNALQQMSKDPEVIYKWAKKYLGFKTNAQPEDIREIYYEKIEEYLGRDEEEVDEENENNEQDDVFTEGINELASTLEEINMESETDDELINDDLAEEEVTLSGIDLLLKIILLTHKLGKYSSQFTRPFDFSEHFHNLDYVGTLEGKTLLSSAKLRQWIDYYILSVDEISKDTFYDFIINKYTYQGTNKQKFTTQLNKNWSKIEERIILITQIDEVLQNAKIGLIELTNTKLSDSQKIFEIINTKGTKLTAVEILSAKPEWNVEVKNPGIQLLSHVQKMYKSLDINSDYVVRWDIPATFIDRLQNKNYLFREYKSEGSDLEKKVTLGFKLLSSIIVGGISKVSISDLSSKNVDWNKEPDKILEDLNSMLKLISGSSFFSYFISWNKSLMEILSDAISLNYISIMYKDWNRKGQPIGSSKLSKTFEKNSIILFDALVYEYLTQQWRGSSDSRVAKNLLNFDSTPDLFIPIEEKKWENLLNEMINNHSMNDQTLKKDGVDKYLKSFLYYYYVVKEADVPSGNKNNITIDVDHIIPRYAFSASSLQNKDLLENNILNLCLLPKKDNISKGADRLNEIKDSWLKKQVVKFTEIEESKFDEFSDLTNVEEFKKYRKEKVLEFLECRHKLLVN